MEFTSIVVPGLKVDTANYLTEIIIHRWCNTFKHKLPKFEFWQKQYESDPVCKELRIRYIAELTQVKKLLTVFSPEVLVQHIHGDNTLYSYRYIKTDRLKDEIFKLFTEQLEYVKRIKINKSLVQSAPDKVEYIESVSRASNNKISQGL